MQVQNLSIESSGRSRQYRNWLKRVSTMAACVAFATLAATLFAGAAVSHQSAAATSPTAAACADAKAAVAKNAALESSLRRERYWSTRLEVPIHVRFRLEADLASMNLSIDTDLKKACGI